MILVELRAFCTRPARGEWTLALWVPALRRSWDAGSIRSGPA